MEESIILAACQDLTCHKINQIIFIIDVSVPLVYCLVFKMSEKGKSSQSPR